MSTKKIIFDFGANNGDNLPYYLVKSDLVVAVEANLSLCEHIISRFPTEIDAGKLIVENCVLTDAEPEGVVPFFIHKRNHVLSQFPRPDPGSVSEFKEIPLPSRNVLRLIKHHGQPYYVKMDIEHYDYVILKELFSNNIKPPYISAESHSIEVFAAFVALGGYTAFKLVNGPSIPREYADTNIQTLDGTMKYSFPYHSAGPFGNDIHGPWMTPDNFFRFFGRAGLGWKDIHASNIDIAGD